MFKFNSISFALLVALCLPHLLFANAAIKVYKESLNYPDRRVIFTPYYYSGQPLTYALCDKNFQAYENYCTVIRKNHLLTNETQSCNFTLKAEQTDGRLGPNYEILPFGENKVIFISSEIGDDTFIKFSAIHLATCKSTVTKLHVDFPYEEALYFVVPSGDSVKVIFENRGQCGDKFCVMSLNSEGKTIGDLTAISKSMKPLSFPIVVSLKTTKDLFFIKSEPRSNKNLILRKSDGSEKSVGKYSFIPRTTVLSAANDLIGVCHNILAAKSNIICSQHDANGQLKFEFTSANKYDQLKLQSMYNLPNGGILLVVEYIDGILVFKIDSQGNMVGSFTVNDFDCSKPNESAASLFELENKEQCISMACREGNDFYIISQSFLNFVTNCFTDEDFAN